MKTLLLAVLLTAPASAQNVDRESQDPGQPLRTEARADAAAEDARRKKELSSEPITFERILGSPDDVALNERYALQQVAAGDLRGAATTLERVLLVDPTRYRTRLLYGVVLVRLDDAADAARELDLVLAVPDVPREVREEAEQYRRIVRARRRDSHFDARVTVGVGFDDDRNAAPDGDVRLVAGVPFTLDEGSRRRSDLNVQTIGSLGGSYDFGGPRGHTAFARVTYYRADQRLVHLLDLQAVSPKVGATLRTPWAEVTPSFSFTHLTLDGHTYLRSRDSDLRVARRWSRAWETWFEFTHSYQDFVNGPRVTTAEHRTGDQLDWQAGASWAPDPRDRLSLTLLHRRKFAQDVRDSAYRRESLGVEWLRLLGKARFLVVTATRQFDRYELPDDTVLPGAGRSDDAFVWQVLYGQPLDAFWRPLRDFVGTVGFERFYQWSNVPNYTYSNDKATLLVTYKWGI
ncbi:MAG: tetratricopeptide repeat protein [Elusimicrobia bacterium]|nr:tetratricopeptide repeat protein [Elusimicrobiota bacterium]